MSNFDINKIDKGIREWVLFLRDNGYETIASCEGCGRNGTTHYQAPQVVIAESEGETIDDTFNRLRNFVGEEPIMTIIGGSSNFPRRIRFVPPYDIEIQKPNSIT